MKKPQLPQYHPQVVSATAEGGMEGVAFCGLTQALIIWCFIDVSILA